MTDTTDRSMAGAVGRRLALAVAIAASVVVIGGCTSGGARPGQVTVLRGAVDTVNAGGSAVGFRGERVAGPRLRVADGNGSWNVAGATWTDGHSWHNGGTPTCLHDTPQAIELGVVEAAPHDDAPGRAVVVWLRCLRRP